MYLLVLLLPNEVSGYVRNSSVNRLVRVSAWHGLDRVQREPTDNDLPEFSGFK